VKTRIRIARFRVHAAWKSLRGRWLQQPTDLIERHARAMQWVDDHGVGGGLAVSDLQAVPYPEVTGYFIPTLLRWGRRDLATRYARWLVSIQNADGSWSDAHGHSPYTFDSAQVLKGLASLVDAMPELKQPILRGCDWVLTQIEPSGRVATPDKSHWNLGGGRVVPEGVHLYALEPLRTAGEKWNIPRYRDAVDGALAYYVRDGELTRFDTLSHFHAYVLDGLIELGATELAAAAMQPLAELQASGCVIPAYPAATWTCATGLFQYAVIWYKLGQRELADRAFADGCALQNATGGFYGSNGTGASYFPHEEIAWPVKYFLDALALKVRSSMDSIIEATLADLDDPDGRYRVVADAAAVCKPRKVLDAGCGKGRFARRIKAAHPDAEVVGMDISDAILRHLPAGVTPVVGTLLDIPFADETFDFKDVVEALEHAIDTATAVHQLARVVKRGGILAIVDKNEERLGMMATPEWEQWFGEEQLSALLRREGFSVSVCRNIPYNAADGSDSLFLGWIGTRS